MFRITGLDPALFRPLFGLDDQTLAAQGVIRMITDSKPGYPDRITLRDGEIGEAMLLLNYTHLPAATPYRASHAIFVREGAEAAYDAIDLVPDVIRVRPISLRAFDAADIMVAADLVDGQEIESVIDRFFGDPNVAYLHAHYAKRGCYAARIARG